MLSVLQIVLISIFGGIGFISLIFMLAFIIEINKETKTVTKFKPTDKVFSLSEVLEQQNVGSVEEMLAKIDEQTEKVEKSQINEVKLEEEISEVVVSNEEKSKDNKEQLVNIVVNNYIPEKKDEEEKVEEIQYDEENFSMGNIIEEPETIIIENNNLTGIDYKTRLEQIMSNRDKIEKELAKVENAILKYDRTNRRKERNQKMLDRRAGELTNLNLLMYSVTDIKNVDEDKKIKQEELTAHIAELKASIQDAEEFLESNKEKNEHNEKMADFLKKEMLRYDREIAELKKLIDEAESA